MANKISRRDFLKFGMMASGAAALAACSPAVKSTLAPAAAATSVPAAAITKKLVFGSYSWSGYEAALNKIIDAWIETQKTKGVNVEVERQYGTWDEYWGKLQTQVAAGTPPDIGIADYGRIVSYAKDGVILNIADRVKSSNFPLDKMMPAALAQYRWKTGDIDSGNPAGDLYGLPADAQAQVMVYNKKMFDAAGVAYPTDDWTWDDMLEAAKKLTKPDQSQYGFSFSPGLTWRGIWINSAGGAFHTPDYKKSLLNTPETKEALQWIWDAIWTHKVSPPLPAPNSQAPNPFISRQVAMTIDGVWWLTDFEKGLDPGEWDVCMFPKHPKTGKRTTTVEADGFWVFKDAKEKDLAFDLLTFFASTDGQKRFDAEGYLVPGNDADIAAAWYAKTPPDNRKKILDNINQDSVKVDITYYQSATVQGVVDPIIMAPFYDGSDLSSALATADSAMNAELDKAWASFNK